jgi:hypothetical protein
VRLGKPPKKPEGAKAQLSVNKGQQEVMKDTDSGSDLEIV